MCYGGVERFVLVCPFSSSNANARTTFLCSLNKRLRMVHSSVKVVVGCFVGDGRHRKVALKLVMMMIINKED